jgi:hypothetical protein
VATASGPESDLKSALRASYEALHEVASYQPHPDIAERMQDLGERKAFLCEAEHKELMALVNFAQRRTVEKLRAELALKQIQAACPELTVAP